MPSQFRGPRAQGSLSPDCIVLPGSDAPTEFVAIDMLVLTGSPRLDGENAEHTRVLAESGEPLPPILVHQPSMRVIDGMHRVRAALIRGESVVEARFFGGGDTEAFVLSVKANIAHGLPLGIADRRAAAEQMLRLQPVWSDRAIAAAAGLSPPTVSALRRALAPELAVDRHRIGRDGRARPLNRTAGREAASDIIAGRPGASLREIADAAGISPSTARDVRQRLQRGESGVPSPGHALSPAQQELARAGSSAEDQPADQPVRAELTESLRNDPSLRFTDQGRAFLRWLSPRMAGVSGWERVVSGLPPHCLFVLAKVARQRADEWQTLADHLDRRTSEMS
jgi:transposase-like protein